MVMFVNELYRARNPLHIRHTSRDIEFGVFRTEQAVPKLRNRKDTLEIGIDACCQLVNSFAIFLSHLYKLSIVTSSSKRVVHYNMARQQER
jgi:hypothetical protein